MKILLEVDNDTPNKELLILTNDNFDIPGWLTLHVGNSEVEIHINDLWPAIHAFKTEYNDHLKREPLL
jgi:hypothetical protein